MKTFDPARALRAAFIVAAFAGASTAALADIKDYRFELIGETVTAAPDQFIATRLDMAPDGMQEMATRITPMPGAEPGTYKFKASFSMAGRWQLSLGAKVQGEAGTVDNKLVITAQK